MNQHDVDMAEQPAGAWSAPRLVLLTAAAASEGGVVPGFSEDFKFYGPGGVILPINGGS